MGFFDARPQAPVSSDDIDVTLKPEDPPRFERIYQMDLPRGCRLKVRLYSSGNYRFDMSEITQGNGRWVMFDVKRPADKILDREILPSVEDACRRILQMDDVFMDSDRDEFTDVKRRTWKRMPR